MNWWNCDLLLKLVKTAFVFIKCNNLRVTLGNSVDMEGLPCQTLFISFSLWEEWTGPLQNFKGKSSFSARKNQFLCVQILCCELLFVDMEALPCKFLMQQMKWILFHADFANSFGRANTSHFWFLITTTSARILICDMIQLIQKCQPVIMSQVLYTTFMVFFYILNLWTCQAD